MIDHVYMNFLTSSARTKYLTGRFCVAYLFIVYCWWRVSSIDVSRRHSYA